MRRVALVMACVIISLFAILPLSADDNRTVLTFAHWGSPLEKEAMAQMCQSFEQAHPNVIVNVCGFQKL